MNRVGAAAAAALLILVAAAGAIVLLRRDNPPVPGPRREAERPPLMLLTTLPLVFPERFQLNAPASPALKALQSRYRIVPISVADLDNLDHRDLLLMAQPQAQPAEALVDLDAWVRSGGRVLLLADPALEWPSGRELGSILRPPFAFADTRLLAHWGLRLEPPDELGPAIRTVDNRKVRTQSPGTLIATQRGCAVASGGFIARCRIASGEATVIADADFLNANSPQDTAANLDFLLSELGKLEP